MKFFEWYIRQIEYPWLWPIAALVCLPLYRLWVEVFFGSLQRGVEALPWLRGRGKPSILDPDYIEAKFSEVRWLGIVGCCLLTATAAYGGLARVWSWFHS